jgi:hypothetical protein
MVLIFAKIRTIRANNTAHCWIAHITATTILVSKDTNPGGGSTVLPCATSWLVLGAGLQNFRSSWLGPAGPAIRAKDPPPQLRSTSNLVLIRT